MKTLRLRLSMLMLLLCCLFANLTPAQAAVDSTTAQDESSAAVPTSPFNDQAGLPVYPPEEEHSFAARIDRSINCSIQKRPFQVIGGLIAFFLGVIIFMFYCLGCKCSRICRMEAQMNKDELTGLPNMEKFKTLCDSLITTQVTSDYMLLSGDICQFKTINDQFGFGMGDRLLQAYAAVLQRNILPEECCARISSDLFVLLLRFDTWEQLSGRVREMDRELDEWRRSQALPYTVRTVYGAYRVPREQERDVQLMLDLANYARLELSLIHI